MLTADELRPYIKTTTFGRKIYAFESIDSTNTFAKSLIEESTAEGSLVIAEEQTAGKGRQGRTWISERGKNLTFSLIVKPKVSSKLLGFLPLCAGVAITEAIFSSSGIAAQCKWPNDVLINGRKVCGILC